MYQKNFNRISPFISDSIYITYYEVGILANVDGYKNAI